MQTQISWRETPRAHVFKAYLPGFDRDDVLVFIDDDRVLQISTEDGKFMSRFKLPDNARSDEIDGFMENGVLLVAVGKDVSLSMQERANNNVKVIEITGDDE
ncbi:hypothetical protein ACFE04_011674 [Oxalis oulophora]